MTATPASTADALARCVEQALDDGKAVDIRVLDVRGLTVITDFMIVASGRSARQVKALTDRVREAAGKAGAKVVGAEGEGQGEWVLVDLGDVIVHIMQPAIRDFYQLEKLWEAGAENAGEVRQADAR
ncbi:MAG: ribosome silencing factor [Gammaproteobacteria bacterium]|nr:ribosome silencing factor [Gammaproteobacteria bacterium]MCP5200623.1 ribosome silencing factor [Gammaproteobacteria bacterium]